MATATVPFNDHQQLRLRNRLDTALQQTRQRARRAALARRTAKELEQKKTQRQDLNPSLSNVDDLHRTIYYWVFAGMLAVYFIDVVLFAAVAEYFAKQSFAGSPWLVSLTRFLIPAAIVVVEMILSIQREAAHREHLEGFGSPARFWGWTAAAVLCNVVMPAAVIAVFVSAEGKDFSTWVSIPLLITLAGLSMVCHLLMLFGGRLALESKAFLLFQWRQAGLQNRIRQHQRVYASESQGAADRFAAYMQDWNSYNAAFPSARIDAGPFDKDARDVVNDVYGYEVIRTPAVGTPAQTPVNPVIPPQPTAAGPGPTEEPAADWRTVYERQMREQESEVRP
jgi:hypothetical protein